ncbi:PAS domain S-box protein [Rhizobium sp. 18065]|uniref:hybrid sensor histidine kinase/response regulator n=1 Tax=Rhizobium sp. 18065 TaxID=2681411 RepID=UPI0032AE8AD5
MNTSFLPLLKESGPTGQLVAAFDWSQTAVGAIETWPAAMRSTVLLIMRSPLAIATLWGPDGIMIYNDGYAAFAGSRHPALLGMKVLDGWPEASDLNARVLTVCLSGDTLSFSDQALTLYREGEPDQAWADLDYSPVMDEAGSIVGVMAVVVETTETVLTEQWLNGERNRLRDLFTQAPGFMATVYGPNHVFDVANDAFFQLVDRRDLVGVPLAQALPELAGQGYSRILDRVFETGKTFTGRALKVDLQGTDEDRIGTRHVDIVCQAILDRKGKITGVFVQGTDITGKVEAETTLRAGEARNRQILDSATDYAIIAFDIDGKVARWNRGAERIFGWSEHEMLGRDADRIFTRSDQSIHRIETEMGLALKHGAANDERWHIRKNGEEFWASGEMSPLQDDSGSLIGFVKVLRDRTSEHQANKKLKESEALLHRAQEVGGVGVFSIDLKSDVVHVSPEFCRIFGVPEAERLPVALIETCVLPEDRHIRSSAQTRSTEEAQLDVQYRIHRAGDGALRYIARKAEFEGGTTEKPARLVGVVQDVTDRVNNERALRESEERFKGLAQALPNHVWTAAADGQLDWFNERIYAYSGLVEGELVGNGWTAMVHPDDLGSVTSHWLEALQSGAVYETEFRLRRHDGVFRWHLVRAVPIRDGEGRIFRWIGTNTDVDELRATREALADLTNDLASQVEDRTADRDRMWRLSTEIMLVADVNGVVTAANPAFLLLLGQTERWLLGKSFMDFVHPDDRRATLDELEKLAQGARTLNFVNRYRAEDGFYRDISWTAVPDGRLIHAVGRDITAEKEAAEALRTTELALQQAQKMESIGNLTGGVAHDFNNLMQVVSGNLQLLKKDLVGDLKAERRIANALQGIDRGAKLASQLLSFGRRQPLEPKVINFGRQVSAMDDMLKRTLGEAVEIETMVYPDLWNVQVDPTQIENALLNLSINARDAMDGAGKLTIEVRNAVLDREYVKGNPEVAPGQYVMLAVSDTGTGMTPDVMEKVFEPFFSTKPEGKGTGLGLSMVYGFVKQSGGHIKIYSEAGQGTSIKLYFPRVDREEDVFTVLVPADIVGGSETILIAEDDEAVRATAVELLTDLGYKILSAKDASAALSILESGAHVDLLFTDVVMPGPLKSPELASIARERDPALAVLFTSGYTENSIVHGGRLDPGVELLSKPYTREAMARKIRHVLANQQQRTQATQGSAPSTRPTQTPAIAVPLDILLVEDDVLIRMNTVDMLDELGHTVTEAGDAKTALDLFSADRFDLLLTDVGLPGMSGIELARILRGIKSDIAVIFATGDPNVPTLPGNGMTEILVKPYSVEAMTKVLHAVSPVTR